MNCLEFKRLALSEPMSQNPNFVEHSAACPQCLKYVDSVRQMDAELADSLDVGVPSDLIARLQLSHQLQEELQEETAVQNGVIAKVNAAPSLKKYAMAASLAIALFVAGFMASNQFGINQQIGQDYESLLSGVADHMLEESVTPVWNSVRANESANTLLASYDGHLKLKHMSNLQFSRICPMGQYKGLHASLETANGQVTFAYIKGEPVSEPLNAAYNGYITRVKPVKGGNLIIVSKTNKAVQDADKQLKKAMYWEA